MAKKLNLDLDGADGNAFALIGMFRREARRAGWTQDEIKKVQDLHNQWQVGK